MKIQGNFRSLTLYFFREFFKRHSEGVIIVPAGRPETARQPAWLLPASPLSPSKSYSDFPTLSSPGKVIG